MTEKTKPAVRITDQYRDRDAMVYELLCEGTRIALRFQESDVPETPRWAASVRTSDKNDDSLISASGATRAEALANIARDWQASSQHRAIPAFEWSQVADALTLVKAL